MSSIFTKGVTKKSEQLRKVSGTLASIISGIESEVDVAGFARRYPNQLAEAVKDLKEARKAIYRAIERLNFPDQAGTP